MIIFQINENSILINNLGNNDNCIYKYDGQDRIDSQDSQDGQDRIDSQDGIDQPGRYRPARTV